MDRRQQAEESYRQKFAELGLNKSFEFLRRDWTSDHGKKFFVKCLSCGAEFEIWNEVLKGRQKAMHCKCCGSSSDGKRIKARDPKVDEAMQFYVQGHSVRETAKRYGFTITDINNFVKKRNLSNGRYWRKARIEEQKKAALYPDKIRRHTTRAKKHGAPYDTSVNLKRLIERDGLRCAICGKMCDPSDRSWSKYCGPLYPSIDHIIPMSKGGSHTWDNVQVAHIICNSRKGDKMEDAV